MSNDSQTEDIDHVLELLSRPLSKYVLAVLAGIDPGVYKGPLEIDIEEQDKFQD